MPRKPIFLPPDCLVSAVVDAIDKDCRLFGLSIGEFSLYDLVAGCLSVCGIADVTISTFTIGRDQIEQISRLANHNQVSSVRILLDPGLASRHPEYARLLSALIGIDNIRTFSNHSKFVVLRNAKWAITITSSMNFNANRRLEQYEINEDARLTDYLLSFVDGIFDRSSSETNFIRKDLGGLRDKIGIGNLSDEDFLLALE